MGMTTAATAVAIAIAASTRASTVSSHWTSESLTSQRPFSLTTS